MFEMTQVQTPTNTTQSFVEMEADGSINLAGRHTARIFQVKRVVSPKGTPYHEVGVEIVIGRAKGRVVFAQVLAGRSREDLLCAAGLEPASTGHQLREDDLVGRIVRITVAPERVAGNTEKTNGQIDTLWTISRFGWDVR